MILKEDDIYLDVKAKNKKEVIDIIGEKMLEHDYIDKKYIKSMHKRDKVASVAIGNYLAIPHAEYDGFDYIKNNGVIMLKLKDPIVWDGQTIDFAIGLALGGDKQIDALQSIAVAFSDEEEVEKLYSSAKTKQDILKFLVAADV